MASANGSCPVCYDCRSQGCTNGGTCFGGPCVCVDPLGFTGDDCSSRACQGRNVPSLTRKSRSKAQPGACCDPGWAGPTCNICLGDASCTYLHKGTETPICNKGAKVFGSEAWFEAPITAPSIDTFYPGTTSFSAIRNRTEGTGFVSVAFNDVQSFTCALSGCAQYVDGADQLWTCTDTKCSCITGSEFCGGSPPDLAPVINDIKGGFSITCPRRVTNPTCTIVVDGIVKFVPKFTMLPGQSTFGECTFVSSEPQDVYLNASKDLTVGEIFCLIFLSGLILSLLSGYFFARKQHQRLVRQKNVPLGSGHLSFSDVAYSIPPPRLSRSRIFPASPFTRSNLRSISSKPELVVPSRQLLQEIGGTARPGRLLAIMGPSGAGKSTLLDILACKAKHGTTRGLVCLNDKPVTPATMRRVSGFVNQEDILLPYLTVRETIAFSAHTRLPEAITHAAKEAIVDNILETLRLRDIQHSRIGGHGVRGISGGERRRVSIGVELVTSPSILFLDEPTSGLDSNAANLVATILVDLAKRHNQIIICTIHQPRSDTFLLFDDLLLLSLGKLLYFGETALAKAQYASRGFACPDGYNVADYLIDLAIAPPSQQVPRIVSPFSKPSALSPDLKSSAFNSSEISLHPLPLRENESLTAKQSLAPASPMQRAPWWGSSDYTYGSSYLSQLYFLASRSCKNLVRDPRLLLAHLGLAVALGILVGGIYFQASTTLSGTQNRVGCIFFTMTIILFSSISALSTFSEERAVFLRERSNGFYSPVPWFINKVFFDLFPLRVIPCILQVTIIYFMLGFATQADVFLKYLLVMVLFNVVAALGFLTAAVLIPNFGVASLVTSTVGLLMMLFGGLLISTSKLSPVVSWLQYLSLFKYSFEPLVVNELSTFNVLDSFNGALINVPGTLLAQEFFGLKLGTYWTNVAILMFLGGAFFVISLVNVVKRLHELR